MYDPVRAEAEGVWRARLVVFAQTYTNACVATSATGGNVFDF
ncbi:hypothetical protein [Actinomadura sp. WMMB 499]|nr:hypothetical protein F7P10_41540 [Actinomadura sp. WMMB 499]